MQQTPFHAYYFARLLENLPEEERLIPVYASSDIRVYPFQVAAANFALRNPNQKGVALCDEAGLGKTHEALLIVVQKWLEGNNRIFIAVPGEDLLIQWGETIGKYYTIPYDILYREEDWNRHILSDNPFDRDAVILTTYDFLVLHQEEAKRVKWDITVFDEATFLSSVCNDGNKGAKTLKEIAEGSFKILLTGTPIEKNIMDVYGLMYFIDETVLPDPETYMKRYLRRPENYPELAQRVSRYFFRTLRTQVKQYAKIPERVMITLEYTPSAKERRLYRLLDAYINREKKLAFPKMDPYDLALLLLGLQSSSTPAILQTIKGVVRRLRKLPNAEEELKEFRKMEELAESIETDTKAKLLVRFLGKIMPSLRRYGAKKKAIIFTENTKTQRMLYDLLKDRYRTSVYNGASGYAPIQEFKDNGEILISLDIGARGFDLSIASVVINYDLLYNTLKMEQRIDRCHRLEQQNDVLAVAFINKDNFADVRKLELISKRFILTGGVFGLSDSVLDGFTDDLNNAISTFFEKARTKDQIQADYLNTLQENKTENEEDVSSAENILFTTFTQEISKQVKITPKYVAECSKDLNEKLWEVVRFYFVQYNTAHTDCHYVMDDFKQTIIATDYEKLPYLFHYWADHRNRKYYSQKIYGMASDFQPRYGRITFSSPLVRGLLPSYQCTNEGTMVVDADIEPCRLAFYSVEFLSQGHSYCVFVGKTDSQRILSDEECRKIFSLPVLHYTEEGKKATHGMRSVTFAKYEFDQYIHQDEWIEKERVRLAPRQAAEVEKMKLQAMQKKASLERDIAYLEKQLKMIEGKADAAMDRLSQMQWQKRKNTLKRDYMQRKENQYLEEMQIDLQLEKDIQAFCRKQDIYPYVMREFEVRVEGKKSEQTAQVSCKM